MLGAVVPAQAQETSDRTYDIVYRLQFDGESTDALARIELRRGANNMRGLRFRIDPRRQMDFEGDGEVTANDDDEVVWTPPREGGALSYRARIPHKRKSGAYDAYVADDWALFRADDVFPPATTRTLKGARSKATLVLDLPDGWSAVTQYRSDGNKLRYPFDTPGRRWGRPGRSGAHPHGGGPRDGGRTSDHRRTFPRRCRGIGLGARRPRRNRWPCNGLGHRHAMGDPAHAGGSCGPR